jgi:hypothetical protein
MADDPLVRLKEAVTELAVSTATADDVADLLRKAGVTGERGHAHSCPIANYLAQVVGIEVSVSGDDVVLIGDESELFMYAVSLSDSVQKFINQFDDDMYPDLINRGV